MTRHIAAAAVIIAMACGCGDGTEAAEQLKIVEVLEVQPGPITEEVFRAARLEGEEEALIVSAAGGRIEEVLVREGDPVDAGDPLVRLVTDRQISSATSAAIAGLNASRTNSENASRSLERIQVLYDAGGASQAQLDNARAMAEAAAAQVAQAQAAYSQALSVAENSYVNSPFSGTVGRVWAREGNMAGGSPLLSISSSSSIVAKVLLPERYLADLRVGLPARAELVTDDRTSYPGMVSAAARSVDPISGMVSVEVSFPNEDSLLFPGQSCRVAIGLQTSMHALTVPEIALIRTTDGYRLALEKDGTVTIVPVETGIRSMGLVEIVSGLEAGDRVIIRGQNLVAQGDRVVVGE